MIGSSVSTRSNRSGSRSSEPVATRTEPPAASTPNKSYTDKSKHNDVTHNTRSPGPTLNCSLTQVMELTTARCRRTTPFGTPVEPEV